MDLDTLESLDIWFVDTSASYNGKAHKKCIMNLKNGMEIQQKRNNQKIGLYEGHEMKE